jgi:hypothetical protein
MPYAPPFPLLLGCNSGIGIATTATIVEMRLPTLPFKRFNIIKSDIHKGRNTNCKHCIMRYF